VPREDAATDCPRPVPAGSPTGLPPKLSQSGQSVGPLSQSGQSVAPWRRPRGEAPPRPSGAAMAPRRSHVEGKGGGRPAQEEAQKKTALLGGGGGGGGGPPHPSGDPRGAAAGRGASGGRSPWPTLSSPRQRDGVPRAEGDGEQKNGGKGWGRVPGGKQQCFS